MPENKYSLNRRLYVAEFIGTFFVVLAPVALSSGDRSGSTGLLASAFVSGLIVTAMISVFAHVSSAHFNPAVTLALAFGKRFDWKLVFGYVLSQISGGICAALLSKWISGRSGGVHVPGDAVSFGQALACEILITFLLVSVILAVGIDKKHNAPAEIVIGLTVVCGVLIGGNFTGGSMNPARSIGPDLVAGGSAISTIPVYIIGPIAGGLIAMWAWDKFISSIPLNEK